ncbi:hypothetical protein JCM11641_001396 [Rhodosporidiobolus odoratus]
MAIFSSRSKDKDSKHKKNGGTDGSASGTSSTASPPIGTQAGGAFPRSGSNGASALGGSIGRSEGSGIPLPAGGGGGSGLYSSSGSAQGLPPLGPGIPSLKQQQPQQPHYGGQHPHPHPGHLSQGPQQAQQHTVLYPWSQRPFQLLPSQLLPPASPTTSPQTAPEPLLGPLSPLPFPRYGHSVNPLAAAASSTGDLYIFGGLVQNTVKNDLYVVHCAPGGQTVLPGTPLQVSLLETRGEVPGPRVGHASVSVGNVLIIWGGDTKTRPEERQDDGLYLLNLSTREWTRVKTLGRAPEGRYGHAAAMVGSRFFVVGGQTDDGGFRNDLWWFDLQKLKQGQPRWSCVDYAPNQVVPPPRTGHTCVTSGDCLYIFGGTDGSYHYNDTWSYDLTTGVWTELACIGYIPVPREGHAATLVDDVMYVFGGRGVDGKDLDDLAAFRISNHRWFMFQNMGPSPSGRSGHAMATWQTKVLVLGGESYTSTKPDDPTMVHVLDTTKIKYPPDSTRPVQQAASQFPAPNAAPTQQSAIPLPGTSSLSSSQNNQRKSSIPVSPDQMLRDRATSPTGSQRGLKSSLTGSIPPSAAASSGGAAGGYIAQAMLSSSVGPSSPPTNSSPTVAGVLANPNSPTGSIGRSGIPAPSSPTGPGGAVGGSRIAKRSLTTGQGAGGAGAAPLRPTRPDDAEAFTAGTNQAQEAAARGRSPTRLPKGPGGGGAGGMGSSQETRQQTSQASLVNGVGVGQASPLMTSLSGFAAQQAQEAQQQAQLAGGAAAPQDGFYHPATNSPASARGPPQPPSSAPLPPPSDASPSAEVEAALAAKDERIRELETRQRWIVQALKGAREKGFEMDGGHGGDGTDEIQRLLDGGAGAGERDEKERRLVEVVMGLKGELGRVKTLMSDQANTLDDRFNAADRARTAALQEAAYYRAKLSAFEASPSSPSSGSDAVSKLDRERLADLEKKLASAASSRDELEEKLERLEQEKERHVLARSTAEDQYREATSRASAAEQQHAKALSDFAELQKRSHGHERTIADHVERFASLSGRHETLEAQNRRYKEQVSEHETSLAGYLATLEASREALDAAQRRNEDLSSRFEHTSGEAEALRRKVIELEKEVEQARVEREAAVEAKEDLQGQLGGERDARDKAHILATGGLAELLVAHKERQAARDAARSTRGVDDDEGEDLDDPLPPHHVARLSALDGELSTLKKLHSDAQFKSDVLAADLEAARTREVDLHHQLGTLRSQLQLVQEQHGRATEEVGRHRSLAGEHQSRSRAAQRAKDAAEVKAGLLRSLLADHGLAAPSEDEFAARLTPLSGEETPEELSRRVAELEGSLDIHKRGREAAEERLRNQDTEAERLREEVERVRAASRAGDEGVQVERERADKSREELEQLQARHQQLEQTHLKAVQYVKGTEKMLRRMKEELTRYKERCEGLESPARQAEVDNLRLQVQDLHTSSTDVTRERDELRQRMDDLQTEYQRTLREQQSEAQAKARELSDELGRLDQELEKAHGELEETLAVNASLNKELQTALKNPTSPRSGQSNEDHSRLQAELEQAYNKAEWLKRENSSLEQRCRTAESKIAILLDHMEGVQSDPYGAGASGSQNGSPHLQQQHDGQFDGSHQQHQHQWERRDSLSDGGSEYDDHPQRR